MAGDSLAKDLEENLRFGWSCKVFKLLEYLVHSFSWHFTVHYFTISSLSLYDLRRSWCFRGTLSLKSYASALIRFCLKKPFSLSTVGTVSTNSLLPKNATTVYTKLCVLLNWTTSLTEVKPALLPACLTYSWNQLLTLLKEIGKYSQLLLKRCCRRN